MPCTSVTVDTGDENGDNGDGLDRTTLAAVALGAGYFIIKSAAGGD